MVPKLITIPFSHYCEKARWAADHVGFAFRERSYLPGAHFLPKWLAGGRTLPVLVTREGTFKDSTDILRYLDTKGGPTRRLYPEEKGARAQVEALEDHFDEGLGPATRLLIYHHLLPDARLLTAIVAPRLTAFQKKVMPYALPLVAPRIRGMYRVHARGATEAEETVTRVFDEASAILTKQPFLGGDRFGAADIAFASLAAPLLQPTLAEAKGAAPAALPADLVRFVTELKQFPAAAHTYAMYRDHRGAEGRLAASPN